MNHIFVDTWAWYALADKTDISHHLVAKETEKLLDADLYICDNELCSV
jgi:predicted nucleic acid-binding protein